MPRNLNEYCTFMKSALVQLFIYMLVRTDQHVQNCTCKVTNYIKEKGKNVHSISGGTDRFLALQTVPPWSSGLPIIPFAYPTVVLVEKRREAARRAGLSFYNNPGKKRIGFGKEGKLTPTLTVVCGLRYHLKNTVQCCGSWSGFAWICIDFVRLDPFPGGQKRPTKKEKRWRNVMFRVRNWGCACSLDALHGDLKLP